jgi:hypothetical protein
LPARQQVRKWCQRLDRRVDIGDDLPSLTRRQILNRDRSTVKARRMPRFRRHWRGYDEGMKADVMGVFDIAGKTGEIARSAGSQLARGTGHDDRGSPGDALDAAQARSVE